MLYSDSCRNILLFSAVLSRRGTKLYYCTWATTPCDSKYMVFCIYMNISFFLTLLVNMIFFVPTNIKIYVTAIFITKFNFKCSLYLFQIPTFCIIYYNKDVVKTCILNRMECHLKSFFFVVVACYYHLRLLF